MACTFFLRLTEKEARRTWPDLVIVKGTTETTVTVYELPPNESVVYVLKDGSNFDTFTGKVRAGLPLLVYDLPFLCFCDQSQKEC